MPVNFAAIVNKPWPFVRTYLEQQLNLGDRLDGVSDDYALGYLSQAVRMDLGKICAKGDVCGSSCISRRKRCSPDRQAATSRIAKEASQKARGKLIEDLKAERDKRRAERAAKSSKNTSNRNSLKMTFDKFENKFKSLYFEERRRQELRGVVAIRVEELKKKFREQYRIGEKNLNSYFDRLKSESKVLVVKEMGQELMQWTE